MHELTNVEYIEKSINVLNNNKNKFKKRSTLFYKQATDKEKKMF